MSPTRPPRRRAQVRPQGKQMSQPVNFVIDHGTGVTVAPREDLGRRVRRGRRSVHRLRGGPPNRAVFSSLFQKPRLAPHLGSRGCIVRGRVSLLGEQSITGAGTGTRARSSRAVALVAFLAARAGSPQPRQRIAGLFWPDSTDAQALTNLRRELHQLRQVLGAESSLVVTATDLCWRDTGTCRVDLRIFDIERRAALAATAGGDDEPVLAPAAKAVAEYRGDLLPGVYDDWVLEVRSEVERQCVGLCDLLGETRARRGDLTGAVEVARRRIQLQPLEEVGYRTLMLLQAGLGDGAGAVSTYHHGASVLDGELGVVPDPATQRAFQRLMARADSGGEKPPVAEAAVSRSGPVAARIVGRSRELGLLQDLWRAATAGS